MTDPVAGSRRSAIAAWFCAGYLATYFLTTALPVPLVWYLPLEHRFRWAVAITGVAMDLYGRVGASLGVGLVAAAIAAALLRRAERPAAWVRRASVWSAVLFVFTAGLYVDLLWGRRTPPVPLAAPGERRDAP